VAIPETAVAALIKTGEVQIKHLI